MHKPGRSNHSKPGSEEPHADAQPPPLPVLDSVAEYEKLHRIGEGTYGVVYKARHIPSGEIVALKKVRFDRTATRTEGVPVTSLRELRVLQSCRHPRIVPLRKVVTGSRADSVFLVFDYAEHDLGRLLDSMSRPFSESEVKCLMQQLLESLAFLHSRWVVHRDIKLSNLLYTRHGVLQLCDFGLARFFQPFDAQLTPRVVTLWYRAPEVLLGSCRYSEAIDCWAAGCVLAELLRHEPLFPAESEGECLQMQAQLLGAPSCRIWPGLADLPNAATVQWPPQPYNLLRRHFPALSEAGLALLNGLLTYDPEQRLSAAQALDHPYFRVKPYPKRPEDMPTFPSTHEGSGALHLGRVAAGQKRPFPGAGAPAPAPAAPQQRQQQLWQRACARRDADQDARFGEAFGKSLAGPSRRAAP